MNVELIKTPEGEIIGWSITADPDNKKEVNTVNQIRNLQFFGIDETAIKYDGREGGDNDNAGTLKWKQKKYIKH